MLLFNTSNMMSGQISEELADIANLPKFRNLNISNNQFLDNDIHPLLDALKTNGSLNILKY